MTDEREALDALGRVGLGERSGHFPAQLSGGEQQRVAIARALINHPRLILADEPTGNLDEANERIVVNLLRELHTAGHTIILVTHDPTIGRLADRRIELAHGRLTQITVFSADDQERIDHLLQQIWIFGEEGTPARMERIRTTGQLDPLRVLSRMSELKAAPRPLKDLMKRSSISLVVRAAGALRECYSDAYIAELETYSLFRFAFIASRKEKMRLHKAKLGMLFEAFLGGDEDEPVFPMLPNSLFL